MKKKIILSFIMVAIASTICAGTHSNPVSARDGGGTSNAGNSGSSSGGSTDIDGKIDGGSGNGCNQGQTCYTYSKGVTPVYMTAEELAANNWTINGSEAFPGYTFTPEQQQRITQIGGIFALRAIGHITGTDVFTRYGGLGNIKDVISGKTTCSDMGGYSCEQMMEYYAECKAATLCNETDFDDLSFFEYMIDGILDDLENEDKLDPSKPPTQDPQANGIYDAYSKVVVTGGSGGGQWGVSGGPYLGNEYTSLEFSTDDSSVDVTFRHYLKLDVHPRGFTPANNGRYEDTFEDVTATYTITGDAGGYGGSWTTNSWTGGNTMYPDSVTISLGLGETRTVCQRITYIPKTYSGWAPTPNWAMKEELINGRTEWVQDYLINNHYRITGKSGWGQSNDACVTITRPNDPSGDGAIPSTSRVYVGENISISYDASAPHYETRRVIGQQWPYMVHPVEQGRLSGGTRESAPPLGIYQNEWSAESDGTYVTLVAPSLPGYKICGSYGYNIAFYWSADGGGYQPEGRSYWFDFGLACSYIAKKPTLGIWNSNLYTNTSSVNTVMSSRDNAEDLLAIVFPSGSATTFGSWSEYLGIIGSSTTGFATGATRSAGNNSRDETRNNPLTISNTNANSYGHSRVNYNSALRQRFETYFKAQAMPISGSIGNIGIGANQTAIYSSDSSITINGNIISANGPYNNIYAIPQTMIFVNGDVNITSNVTRIDAWIIATGRINTCVDFVYGVTESSTRYSGTGGACQQQITFNGPVMSSSLNLRRSFGSDLYYGPKYTVAEIFNYRATDVLWSYAQAGRYASSYNEAYTRELAPRY